MDMKKVFLQFFSFSLLFFATLNSNCQSYIPLLQSGNQWNVLDDEVNPTRYTSIFKVDVDTIINGKSCKKIVSTLDSSSTASFIFICYMHEDTVTKKIYTLDNQYNHKLYFDFNAQVGDSLFIPSMMSGFASCDTFIVAQVGNETYGGISRKKITLDFLSGTNIFHDVDVWIEGIGSMHGLIFGTLSPLFVGSQYKLLCMSNNDQLIYQNPNLSYCYYSNVGIETVDKQDVLLYPNPVSDVLNICNLENKKAQMQVFDSFGCLVLQQNLSEANNQISLSNLKAGMYNMLIYNDRTVITSRKIIKN